ncbi:hypothetical protein F4802DRAFT_618208 [Xylaria palmicola]|nr:hypothetical protein F4802DRAFT_618208 [Xylaria palmicola]
MDTQRPVAAYAPGRAPATSEITTRTDAARIHDAEPMEFILSSNWVLLTQGIEDFYEVLYAQEENLEIFYDTVIRGFMIKCLSYDEVRMVTLVNDILDQLVQKESEKGLEKSAKVTSIDCWRENEGHIRKEHKISDKYSFPRDVALCKVRDTWDISGEMVNKGITISRVFPISALSKLQELTDTVLIPSYNGRIVYVGAPDVEKVTKVKRKLDTLVRFFFLTPRGTIEIVKIFLHNEDDRSTVGEYRYVAEGNEKLLSSYTLDRFDGVPRRRYPAIFQKGVVVRLNPKNHPWQETQPLSQTILPIVKDGSVAEEFGAFKPNNWRYRDRHADSPTPGSGRSTIQSSSNPTAHQEFLRPRIENWVSSLSSPKDKSDRPPKTETMEHHVEPIASTSNRFAFAESLEERYPPEEHDAFAHLWENYKEASMKSTSGNSGSRSSNSILQGSLLDEEMKPSIIQSDEKDSRSFHVTMKQKAGSRTVPKNIFPEFDPNTMMSINESLASLLAPLKMRPGIIDLKVDVGRFYFLNVRKSHIQKPRDDDDEKHLRLGRILSELNKRHTAKETLCFTRVLTSLGADANYIGHMKDNDGKPLWTRPIDERTSSYEFTCRARKIGSEHFEFIVDIDATNFTSSVKQFNPDQKFFMVNCTKRVWDFQLVLSVSQDLNDLCGCFAEDLVRSLQVRATDDRIPELEVRYHKDYDVEILALRTRNIACCTSETPSINMSSNQASSRNDILRLYISEVWEMNRLSIVETEQEIQLKFARYKDLNEGSAMPLMWYEATLKSDIFSTAFKQNKGLELGDEAEWKSEELLKSGAVEALVQKAADMVKRMDGVGYWNDNHQEELLHNIARGKPTNDKVFW